MQTSAPTSNGHPKHNNRKRQRQGGQAFKRLKLKNAKPLQEGSHEEVLVADVRALFEAQKLDPTSPQTNTDPSAEASIEQGEDGLSAPPTKVAESKLPEPFTETEVKVVEISSTGDGLAVHPESKQIYVVPFAVPGDVVKVKVVRHHEDENYTSADFVSITEPSPLRDESRVKCKYFSSCSGCQFQMLDYPTQLEHKKSIVQKAYKNFSQLPPELIPAIGDTFGSPLQYGYRTKLTPHFDGPPGYLSKADKRNGARKYFDTVPNIGFMQKGRKITMDIEDCPIGTDAVRMGMKRERVRVGEELKKYAKGATILLRESTKRVSNEGANHEAPPDTIMTTTYRHTDFKTCITDNNATSTEYIDDFVFTSIAGSFFQNNNSILPGFTQYIRDHIMPPASDEPKIRYLIDAYSGSGLFTITLSSLFEKSIGIDVSTASITSARHNASLNKLSPEQCQFLAADANELFKSVTFPSNETVVVLDPPRKGCDSSFLNQLLKFAPRRVVYVSCNVHTQARDVGTLVRGQEGGVRYEIESLRGFDFFPQTSHVEGVAVLSRVDGLKPETEVTSEEVS